MSTDQPEEPPGPPPDDVPRRWWPGWLAWTLVLALLWLGLAGQWDAAEAAVALLLGAVAAAAGLAARHHAGVRHRPTRQWLRHGPGMLGQAFSDCVILAAALGRRVRGQRVEGVTVALPCDVGGPDGASTARRVLMTVGTSLQPNSYVLGFDHERQRVIVHQLMETDSPPIADDLRGQR